MRFLDIVFVFWPLLTQDVPRPICLSQVPFQGCMKECPRRVPSINKVEQCPRPLTTDAPSSCDYGCAPSDYSVCSCSEAQGSKEDCEGFKDPTGDKNCAWNGSKCVGCTDFINKESCGDTLPNCEWRENDNKCVAKTMDTATSPDKDSKGNSCGEVAAGLGEGADSACGKCLENGMCWTPSRPKTETCETEKECSKQELLDKFCHLSKLGCNALPDTVPTFMVGDVTFGDTSMPAKICAKLELMDRWTPTKGVVFDAAKDASVSSPKRTSQMYCEQKAHLGSINCRMAKLGLKCTSDDCSRERTKLNYTKVDPMVARVQLVLYNRRGLCRCRGYV